MKHNVNNYEDTSCLERKTNPQDKKKASMVITNSPQTVSETLHMDIVGPLSVTENRNRYLLTFQDSFFKYPEAVPIPDQTAETVTKHFVTEIVCKHGTPKSFLSDRGSQFMSELFTEVCKLLKINKIRTTVFHPQTNGQVDGQS